MKLVVGLGNPGIDYRDTYHNIGFNAADILAARFNVPELRLDKKFNGLVSDFSVSGEKVLLVKPQTYMNLSGDCVEALARYYKLAPSDILVLYDDIDIPKGTVRARLSGSAGTHNGMRDIVSKLRSQEFARVRIGTGFRPPMIPLVDYVLMHFISTERPLLSKACEAAADFAEAWLRGREWQTLTVTVEA